MMHVVLVNTFLFYIPVVVDVLELVDVTSDGDHPESITFDKNGYMYLTGHSNNRVVRYPPNSAVGTSVAGVAGASGTALNNFKDPLGMDLDDSLNLYVAERGNKRVMKWTPSATAGTIVIGTGSTPAFYGLLLYSSNQVYVSSQDTDSVYLWTFGASSASVTLTQVNDTTTTLKNPR
ncbi:unnamed protein product, partial [Rotaria sordida]